MNQREFPYFWVTWLTGFLVGSEQCLWKPWAKAHYYTTKLPDGYNNTQWQAQHTALLNKLNDDYSRRYPAANILREDQTKWVLKGTLAEVGGKMDLIIINPADEYNLIVDAKSGKQKPEDIIQMQIYQIAVEKNCIEGISGRVPGVLWYGDRPIDVPPPDDAFKQRFYGLVRQLATYDIPDTTPSVRECKYCNIKECIDRDDSTERKTNVDEF